jgi:hypothetical protein
MLMVWRESEGVRIAGAGAVPSGAAPAAAPGTDADVSIGTSKRARPKSRTLRVPFAVSMMLPGFRSRCVIPFEWAKLTASTNGIASSRNRGKRKPPAGIASVRVLPSISSMEKKRMLSCSSTE